MANLESLIRVRKHNVEQQQKVVAELYRKSEELKDERDALEAQLAIESGKSSGLQIDMLEYFSSYVKHTRKTIGIIDDKRKRLERQITLAQDKLREAYTEQKKVEIINKRRKDAQKAKEDKKDSKELDEIAIEGFRRQSE